MASEAFYISHCLSLYVCASQMVNLDKSKIYFSHNTTENIKEDICNIAAFSNYLGMPSVVPKNKKAIFNYMQDRIWKLMLGWKGSLLSRAEKEIMLKTVVQSIPNYLMSVFLLPKGISDNIEKSMNSY